MPAVLVRDNTVTLKALEARRAARIDAPTRPEPFLDRVSVARLHCR